MVVGCMARGTGNGRLDIQVGAADTMILHHKVQKAHLELGYMINPRENCLVKHQ